MPVRLGLSAIGAARRPYHDSQTADEIRIPSPVTAGYELPPVPEVHSMKLVIVGAARSTRQLMAGLATTAENLQARSASGSQSS